MELDFALLALHGTNSAAEAFADARDRSDRDAPWVRDVGLVEHHENDRLVLRGTFAGRYVDVDENLHTSEHGRDVGAGVGALLGALLGPLGFAEGVVVGGQLGATFGKPDEVDPEPPVLIAQLRAALPLASSAIALLAKAPDVDEMVAAVDGGGAVLTRRTLSAEEVTALEAALRAWPAASSGPRLEGEVAVEESGG
jgi:uncharacterized membrane protein